MEWEAEPNALGFYAKMDGRQMRTAPSEWGRELAVMAVDLGDLQQGHRSDPGA